MLTSDERSILIVLALAAIKENSTHTDPTRYDVGSFERYVKRLEAIVKKLEKG